MKICIITGCTIELPPEAIGAMEILWYDIGKKLSEHGHFVQIIGCGNEQVNRDCPNLYCTIVKKHKNSKRMLVNVLRDFFTTIRCLRCMRTCDVLIPHNLWGPIVASVLFRRKYKKIVYNVARFPRFHYRFYKSVDAFVSPTRFIAEMTNRYVDGSKSFVIGNPIDASSFFCSNINVGRVNDGQFIIGFHGRINEEKGLHLLAQAVAALSKISETKILLRLIGSYEIEKGGSGIGYFNWIQELSGNRIEWVPAISNRKELAKRISECDCYCYPSIAEEGETFGVAPLEAMALGIPVIVSDLRCFNDFVINGVTGLVFNHRCENSVQSLMDCVRVIMTDSSLRNKLVSHGVQKARTFSNEAISKKFEDLFKSLV